MKLFKTVRVHPWLIFLPQIIFSFAFFYSPTFAESLISEISEQQITRTPYDNRNPRINQNGLITWTGFVNNKNQVFVSIDNKISRLTKHPDQEITPDINKHGTIVWAGKNGSDYDIYVYENGNIKTITQNNLEDIAPSINDKGEIVWQGGRVIQDKEGHKKYVNQILLYDRKKVIQVKTNNSNSRNSDINNSGEIVFRGTPIRLNPATGRRSRGGHNIFLKKRNGQVKQLSLSKDFLLNYYNPRINDKGMVVWAGQRSKGEIEIFLYDGKKTRMITNSKGKNRRPVINNKGKIVWQRSDGNDSELFLYDGKTIHQLTDNDYQDIEPSINDRGDIVWVAQQGRHYQIMRSTISHLIAFPSGKEPSGTKSSPENSKPKK